MSRYWAFILVGLFAFSCKMDAQLLKTGYIDYFHGKVQLNKFEKTTPVYKELAFQNSPTLFSTFPFSPNYSLKCTLPKGAVFCRMEDAIYNHLNFWLKFRMGTDDRYSN